MVMLRNPINFELDVDFLIEIAGWCGHWSGQLKKTH